MSGIVEAAVAIVMFLGLPGVIYLGGLLTDRVIPLWERVEFIRDRGDEVIAAAVSVIWTSCILWIAGCILVVQLIDASRNKSKRQTAGEISEIAIIHNEQTGKRYVIQYRGDGSAPETTSVTELHPEWMGR